MIKILEVMRAWKPSCTIVFESIDKRFWACFWSVSSDVQRVLLIFRSLKGRWKMLRVPGKKVNAWRRLLSKSDNKVTYIVIPNAGFWRFFVVPSVNQCWHSLAFNSHGPCCIDRVINALVNIVEQPEPNKWKQIYLGHVWCYSNRPDETEIKLQKYFIHYAK